MTVAWDEEDADGAFVELARTGMWLEAWAVSVTGCRHGDDRALWEHRKESMARIMEEAGYAEPG